MGKTKFPKSVSFNTKNEDDQKILKHVSRRNFSGYVKKLILEDIKKKEVEKAEVGQKSKAHKKQMQLKQPQNIVSPLINIPK
ncbi:hypothetical protein [Metabacillus idriensis]|uniref:hypothetical protein n=1 Tax=Metabacillus idriensis TaxID=324768 RepID=UPI00174DACF0|nr:hypothetical protein [Metabacillus idriensis]